MKNTVVTFQEAKDKGEKLSMLTAYDYSTARLIDEAGVNAILVGGIDDQSNYDQLMKQIQSVLDQK